jgi:hypothetical protein
MSRQWSVEHRDWWLIKRLKVWSNSHFQKDGDNPKLASFTKHLSSDQILGMFATVRFGNLLFLHVVFGSLKIQIYKSAILLFVFDVGCHIKGIKYELTVFVNQMFGENISAQEIRPENSLRLILWRYRYLDYMESNGRIIDELWIGEDLKASGYGLIEAISQQLSGENREHHENSVMIAGVPAETGTEHFPNKVRLSG